MKRVLLLILLLFVLWAGGCAYRPAPETFEPDRALYECRRTREDRIRIDGVPDEAAWRRAPVMQGFHTAGRDPQPAVASTRVRMRWDQHRLYLFFECESPDFRVFGSQRNDEIWHGEAAETFLAPEGPDAPYYEVNVNPDGVIFDSRILDWRYEVLVQHYRQWAADYEADLELVTQRRRDAAGDVIGWDVEIAIPFVDLGMPDGPGSGEVWRFNVCRAAPLTGESIEFSTWHSTGADFQRPHRFARLVFKN